MLIVELNVVLQLATGKDLEKLEKDRLAVLESNDAGVGGKLLEVESAGDVDGHLDESDGNVVSLGGVGRVGEGLERLQEEVVRLPATVSGNALGE